MYMYPEQVILNKLNCPHCKFTSKYDVEFINDAIHQHKEILCVACGGHFKIVIEGLTSAAELLRAPAEPEQKCPACFGDCERLHNDGLMHKCQVCDGTGISNRSGRG